MGHGRTYAASVVLSMCAKEMEGEENERAREGERKGERERDRDGTCTCMYACGMLIEAVICCTCLYTEKTFKGP